MSQRIIGYDYETFYHKSKKGGGYSITQMGDYQYMHSPRFDAYLLTVADDQETWAGHPRDFNFAALDGQILTSHNAHFDSGVHDRLVELGVAPVIKPAAWFCTANMSAYLCNRRSLEEAAKHLLGIELEKHIRDEANGKTGEQLRTDGSWPAMVKYARRDSVTSRELFVRFGHLWPDFERQLADQTSKQGKRGVQIDVEKLTEYIKIAHTMLKDCEATLPWIQDGYAPTSPKAIAERCRMEGIPSPPVKAHEGEEAFDEWEALYSPRFAWAANVAKRRSINKFLDSLETIKERLTPEGILQFRLKYFGAHTGRWSGDGGVNFQNFRKEPLFRDDGGFLISEAPRLKEIEESQAKKKPLPGYVTAALDIRSLIIPRAGKDIIVSDLSQIEPRVLSWVTGNQEMMDMMAAGQSPYEAFARQQMGWTGGDMKKEDKNRYALSKAQVLSLGYQAAWEKFISMAQTHAGIDITKDDPEWVPVLNEDGETMLNKDGTPKLVSGYGTFSKKCVKDFRARNLKIVGLWKHLDTAFRNSVLDGEFSIELPSGRSLTYRKVAREWTKIYDEEKKEWRNRLVVRAEAIKNGRLMRVPIYGGLLTENMIQAIARDVFGEHLLALDREFGEGTVLFSAHDEAVCEVDKSVSEKDVERVMSRCPDWLKGCPIAAEAKKVPWYLK
jgi:DNA polymerase